MRAASLNTPDGIECLLCGKGREDARILLHFSRILICDECVELCYSVVRAELRSEDWERLKGFAP